MSGAAEVGYPSNCRLALGIAALEMQAGLDTGTQHAGALSDPMWWPWGVGGR